MKKLGLVFALGFLLLGGSQVYAQEDKQEKSFEDRALVSMERLEKPMGADPMNFVLGDENYLLLQDSSGLYILSRENLALERIILAEEVDLYTQGDKAFGYGLEGEDLYMVRKEGDSFVYRISQGSLEKIPYKELAPSKGLSAFPLEDLGQDIKKDAASGYQFGDQYLILENDLNRPILSKISLLNQDKSPKLQKEVKKILQEPVGKYQRVFLGGKERTDLLSKGKDFSGIALRKCLEEKGYQVLWREDRKIEVLKGDFRLLLDVDKREVIQGKEEGRALASKVWFEGDRTYVGLKNLEEIFGLSLKKDLDQGILTIE